MCEFQFCFWEVPMGLLGKFLVRCMVWLECYYCKLCKCVHKFVYHGLLFKSLGKILPCFKSMDVCLCSMPLPLHCNHGWHCLLLFCANCQIVIILGLKFNFPMTFCNNILQFLIPFHIEKIKILGLTGKEAQWLDSYISNRTELVETIQKTTQYTK